MSKRTILGGAVKAIRCSKAETDPEFSAARFATRCLMSPAHLCNIEAGRKYPPEDVIHRIAAQLGVPVSAISFIGDKSLQVAA